MLNSKSEIQEKNEGIKEISLVINVNIIINLFLYFKKIEG